MNKLKFLLTASIAAVLTISCASDDDETTTLESSSSSSSEVGADISSSSGDGSFDTETTYGIFEGNGYFQYNDAENDNEGECSEGKFTPIDPTPSISTVNYEISNNILTWTVFDDTIKFNGNSNSLTGAWTRSINRNADCNSAGACKRDYNIVKVVFANQTVNITRNNCPTQSYNTGDSWGAGWTVEVVDCSTLKIKKGTNTLTQKITETGYTYTFGATPPCTYQNLEIFSFLDKRNACTEAYSTYGNDDYERILNKDYYACMETFPTE